MKLEKEHVSAMETLAGAHFALQQRLNEIIFLEGAKLFEPLKDMSLDPGDIQLIENKLFKSLEQYPEFGKYVSARKQTIASMITLLTTMKGAKEKDWKKLIEMELGLQITKGMQTMVSKMGMAYGSKSYIQ